jgi:hypothetical protein
MLRVNPAPFVAALALLSTSLTMARPASAAIVISNTEAGGITTTVTAVDYGRRLVTLTGPRGNSVTLAVGPEVVNFDRVHAGDTVAVSFLLKQLITVVAPGARMPRLREARSIERAPRGGKPHAVVTDTTEFASEIVEVDVPGRGVWLRSPAGSTFRVAVAAEVANLDQLRAGDRVIYRETTVITAFAGEVLPGDVKVGTLQCDLSPTIGLVVGSHQTLACRFQPDNGGPMERYAGSINRIGLDIGVTAGGRLAWAVYAPTTGLVPGGLAGTYVGASGDVTIGVGIGANLLVGGSGRTAALQPLSVEGQFGANLALGIANLSLWSVP